MSRADGWETPDEDLGRWIDFHRRRAIESYRANPLLVGEHGRQEDSFRTGGYAQRQILELVQNAADALGRSGRRGRVEIVLRDDVLYCANEGVPFTQEGLEAVCHAYLSDKRGDDMGRFGLGFKSTLGVADAPLVLSRSVSFGFNAESSRRTLAEIAPRAPRYPVLRLPELVEADEAMKSDPVLSTLGRWAQTIVRLPLVNGAERLLKDMHDFPLEFLLFAPFVSELRIGLPDGTERRLCCEEVGEHRYRLVGAEGSSSEWMVWNQTHRPSEPALAEVGEAIRRPEVTVTYAAPLDDTQTLGRFWAYFPLTDSTSARGIHNAPWHISDDRTNLLPGPFNEELLTVVADLVVAALPHLTTTADPARHFDYMPARGREYDNFADRRLADLIPAEAAKTACVPDANGILRQPSALAYANFDLQRLGVESFRRWQATPGRPVRSPDWTCYRSATRSAKLRRLVRGDATKPTRFEMSAGRWLEHLVSDASDDQCAAALRVFMSVDDDGIRRDMCMAAVLPDTAGTLNRLDQTSHLFLRGHALSAAAGIRLVRPSFLGQADVEDALRSIGFKDVRPQLELRALASGATSRWGDSEWRGFWELVLEVGSKEATEILLEHLLQPGAVLKVLCRNGTWQHVGCVVIGGLVNPVDLSLVVDDGYHEMHYGILRSIGIGTEPMVTEAAMVDLTQLEYRRLQRSEYLAALPSRGRPEPQNIDFVEDRGPTPLHVLRKFADSHDDQARVIWTRKLLEIDAKPTWTLRHSVAASKQITAPHIWAAQQYGLLDTAWGPREAHRSLDPSNVDLSPMLPVTTWRCASKVTTISGQKTMPLDAWREFLAHLPTGGTPGQLGSLIWASFERMPHGEVPEKVPAVRRDGYDSVEPTALLLAGSDDESRALREQDLPFVALDDSTSVEALCAAWGCQPASSALRVEIVPEAPGEAVFLLDRFQRLRDHGRPDFDQMDLVSCSSLHRLVTLPTGTDSHPQDFAVSGRTIYFDKSIDDEDLLGKISAHFGLGLDARTIQRILGEAASERIQKSMAECRALRDPAAKLLVLLDQAVLEANVPAGLLDIVRSVSGDTGDRQVAQLLVHVYGYGVLSQLRGGLKAEGYPVPENWAGSAPAVAFVRMLGFPSEFAGERGRRRDSDLTVLGPPNLPPLHDYQEELATQIRGLARTTDSPSRALLFLPTGAGKTRVTVEALVRSIVARDFDGHVLWMAQSDELCEQAVQTWQTVWRQFGDRPLRIGRLWSSNQVASSDSDASVIVATDAKLDEVRAEEDYEWLRAAAIVVIDEAHGATAKSVTEILRWLGIDQRRTDRPLLGLTATPFKGTGEGANQRLATRFGKRLLNVLGDDPYSELQRRGYLARVEHRVLPGSAYLLDVSEEKTFETFGDVPRSVLERIGRDRDRTLRLVDDISAQPSEWPILVFTSSVLAAQTLSVLLRVRGITSEAVSGSTPMQERRRTIEAFRDNKIHVLVNCNVLTQGFDAPGVRALYIARPTFSPNAYIQMVGRGLRGAKNGGKPECLVVNVSDTFAMFGKQLAYNEFDYLWNHGSGDKS